MYLPTYFNVPERPYHTRLAVWAFSTSTPAVCQPSGCYGHCGDVAMGVQS